MKKKLQGILIIVVLIGLTLFAFSSFLSNNQNPEKVANISLPTKDGIYNDLNDLKGKYVLLHFWASWCPSCVLQIDNYQIIKDKYQDATFANSEGLEIYSVSLDESQEEWVAEMTRLQMKGEHNVIDKRSFESPILTEMNINRIPAVFLIDVDGQIIATNPNLKEIDAQLSQRSNMPGPEKEETNSSFAENYIIPVFTGIETEIKKRLGITYTQTEKEERIELTQEEDIELIQEEVTLTQEEVTLTQEEDIELIQEVVDIDIPNEEKPIKRNKVTVRPIRSEVALRNTDEQAQEMNLSNKHNRLAKNSYVSRETTAAETATSNQMDVEESLAFTTVVDETINETEEKPLPAIDDEIFNTSPSSNFTGAKEPTNNGYNFKKQHQADFDAATKIAEHQSTDKQTTARSNKVKVGEYQNLSYNDLSQLSDLGHLEVSVSKQGNVMIVISQYKNKYSTSDILTVLNLRGYQDAAVIVD